MKTFILNNKEIPDVATFHNAVKEACSEFDGFLIEDSQVEVLLTCEVTQEIIDVIEAVVPPQPQIPDVTPRQMRQALIMSGISLSQIEAAIDSFPEPTKSLARVEWEYSMSFQRNRPLVHQVQQILGWTDEQVDELWKVAAQL